MSEQKEEETTTAIVPTDEIECVCEICQQQIRAKTLPLLELAYQLHKRDHELEDKRAANRILLVKDGNGWILTKRGSTSR
jgi:hypothetical protein